MKQNITYLFFLTLIILGCKKYKKNHINDKETTTSIQLIKEELILNTILYRIKYETKDSIVIGLLDRDSFNSFGIFAKDTLFFADIIDGAYYKVKYLKNIAPNEQQYGLNPINYGSSDNSIKISVKNNGNGIWELSRKKGDLYGDHRDKYYIDKKVLDSLKTNSEEDTDIFHDAFNDTVDKYFYFFIKKDTGKILTDKLKIE